MILLLFVVGLLAVGISYGQGSREVLATSVSGTVEYMEPGVDEWKPVAKGMVLYQAYVVRTGANSRCTLLFKGMSDATVELRPESTMELETVTDLRTGDDTELDLSLGAVLVKAETLRGGSSFKVRTPNSVVGIRGTEFEVSVD